MLERCIASVATQTYPRIEHVVVDGGSQPPVRAALERAGIAFVSEPDGGQTNAINKGFAMAGGDLLGWLNADDTLRPDAVARVVATLRQHPAAGWAYGDCEFVGGRAAGVWKAHSELTESLIRAGEVVPQPGSFVWSSALADVGPLDESFHFTMDVDMFLRLIDGGYRPVYVRGVLARFEVHPGSKTGGETRAAFLEEHARALARSGRATAAAVMYGRAAVTEASAGSRLDVDSLRRVVPRFAGHVPDAAPAGAFQAGMASEQAIVQVRTRPFHALRSLFAVDPWRFAESRTLLFLAGRRALRFGRPRI
jgi:hypothetical protein